LYEVVLPLSAPLRNARLVASNQAAGASPVGSPTQAEIQAREQEESRRLLAQQGQLIEQTLRGLTDVVRGLELRERQRLAEMQRATVELATAIAEKLLHERLAAGSFPIEQVVREVLAKLKPAQSATVYLNREDLELLAARCGGTELIPGKKFRLVADPGMKRGSCRAESGEVNVSSTLEMQLQMIRERLTEQLHHARIECAENGA
jgi:flagellar biosynthesis/type III secretory pathway protein FliH